jgi:hypothetical protein
LLRK